MCSYQIYYRMVIVSCYSMSHKTVCFLYFVELAYALADIQSHVPNSFCFSLFSGSGFLTQLYCVKSVHYIFIFIFNVNPLCELYLMPGIFLYMHLLASSKEEENYTKLYWNLYVVSGVQTSLMFQMIDLYSRTLLKIALREFSQPLIRFCKQFALAVPISVGSSSQNF